jgi:hypothetical protein
MRAALPLRLITQMSQGADEFGAVAIPGNLHTAKTSSRI